MRHGGIAGGLEIRLLGGCAISYRGEPATGVNSPRLQSLLAYLLLHRSAPQCRQYLAFLLWPDSAEDQARTNLRQLLHHLKRVLPDADRFILADGKSLQWDPRGAARLDVADFDRLLDEGKPSEAASLYRGRLLPACYDDWIQPERERLEERFREALAGLAQEAHERGDHRAAIRCGRQMVRHAPTDEAAYLALIRAYAAVGDRAEAIRTFRACASALSRELGVGPSPATLAAYQAVLQTAGREPARRPAESQLFVGRVHELARLEAAAAEAESGRSCVTVVVGEAGIGKTRLADEWRRRASHRGLATAWTRAYPTSRTLAYAPVAHWLRSEAIRPALRRLERPWPEELARLLPELAGDRRTPRRTPPGAPADGWHRLRLFEALARAVLVQPAPLLLFLDDLQWCDQETLDWLAFLMRFDPAAKLLLVATTRVEEIPAGHPVSPWLQRLPNLKRIELGPLGPPDTAALAAAIAGRRLQAEEAERVYRETEGHPLFVVEAARPGGDAAGLQAILAVRLDALAPETRELLGLAATIGRSFSLELLATASGRSDEELVRCLEEAGSRRLIRDRGDGVYDFALERLREEAGARVSTARKRLYQRAVARALERQRSFEPEGSAGRRPAAVTS